MENKKYYKTLDIIRVLSCVAVFLYHLNILKGGYLAVCIFFVLSGYLACNSAFNKEKFSLKNYYLNRLKHIYLPLLFVIFLSILVITLIPNINWLTLKPETISVLGGYNNYWQINANTDYFARFVSSPFMHFWYIAILLQFEIIFPFIFILLKKLGNKHKSIPIVILVLLSLISTGFFFYSSINDPNIMNVYYNSLTRVFSIIFGMSLGFILHYYKAYIHIKNKVINKITFCIYLLILIVLCIFIDSKSNLFSWSMILTTLISCRLIDYATYDTSYLTKFDRFIKYLANISYEVYLIQYPVIFVAQYILFKSIFTLPFIFITTFILSVILHTALDKKKKVLRYVLLLVITITSLFGVYKYIIEEDHTKELNDLREQLNKNEKNIINKKKEYQENLKKENEEFQKQLEELENGSTNLESVVYNLPITGVGDSVMLGASPRLYKTFPNGYFDAKVSRTDYHATELLQEIVNKGMMSDIVVIHLGTNGSCGNRCRNQMMNVLGNRTVLWLTVSNDYEVHVNNGIKEFVNSRDNAYLVDWEAAGVGHPEYFAADKVHLNSSGITAYCNVIYSTIYNIYQEQLKMKKEEMINNHNNLLKKKITFYGNDLLINAFKSMENDFNDADFVMDKDFNYNKLIEKIKKEKPNYNVVFVFDSSFRLSSKQYKEIVNLLKDNNIYVLKINNDKVDLNYDNVEIIDFTKNKDYMMVDNIHLNTDGNNKINELLKEKLKKEINQ